MDRYGGISGSSKKSLFTTSGRTPIVYIGWIVGGTVDASEGLALERQRPQGLIYDVVLPSGV
jgi:hypothetical protein